MKIRHYPVTVSAESRNKASTTGRDSGKVVPAQRSASQETGQARNGFVRPLGRVDEHCRLSPPPIAGTQGSAQALPHLFSRSTSRRSTSAPSKERPCNSISAPPQIHVILSEAKPPCISPLPLHSPLHSHPLPRPNPPSTAASSTPSAPPSPTPKSKSSIPRPRPSSCGPTAPTPSPPPAPAKSASLPPPSPETPHHPPSTTREQDLTLATPTRSEEITVTTGTPTPLAQSGAPISILNQSDDYPHALAIDAPLRLIPGVQITSAGQPGAVTSIFMRGGNSDFTKVLVDGVPVNDIGSLADLSTLAGDGLGQAEVLRQPNSVLYGSDVLAGVVSLSTARGTTPLPLFTYAVDGGNLGTLHQAATIGGARSHADYYTGVGVLQTANNQPVDQFHSTSFFGNYGVAPDAKDDLRLTFRHTHTNAGTPNATLLYGVPDLINQFYAETFLSLTGQQQTTPRWHNLARYGWQALNLGRVQYGSDGTFSNSAFAYVGNPVTIYGANGYSTSGQGIIDYSATSATLATTRRAFAYGQSDYRVSHYLTALGSFQFESEKGASQYSTAARRNFSGTLQFSGDALSRLFYVVGTGIEANDLYGKALTPRASLAFYAFRPDSSKFFSGTKLHASFGKGVEEPSIGDQIYSLYNTLTPAQDAQYGVIPLRGQFSRTYDAGVEQLIGDGRARINLSWFHNQFTNVLEYVPDSGLKQLGVPAGVYTNPSVYGGPTSNSARLPCRRRRARVRGPHHQIPLRTLRLHLPRRPRPAQLLLRRPRAQLQHHLNLLQRSHWKLQPPHRSSSVPPRPAHRLLRPAIRPRALRRAAQRNSS